MPGANLTQAEKKGNESRIWETVVAKIEAERARYVKRYPRSIRVRTLERMLASARARDDVSLLREALVYVKRFRCLPPGIYATAPAPRYAVYLDGTPLEPGRRSSDLTLGVVHPQIYR